ncbi:Uncharacterised protein [Actinomyces bovis]|uniref:DUF6457 domain-containing protein n=1 Tax=Actinomyces bovis TaxID=1658 RepID=A0ABY1VP94_9ACTO|nr:DUF6457 domain-containing protein [Actinomyces bovis]SPT53507.1 Uncharacterised protein [Actinomyces bovis]VEG55426.1 Uncharacterised protein [Actinomyces israelii]
MGRTEADETAKMEQMRHWLDALCTELQLDPTVVQDPETPLLKLISTVAHGPSRPGAPMTAFVVGYVAASTGRPTAEVIAQVQRLAEGWEQ